MADYPVSKELVIRKLLELRDVMDPYAKYVLDMAISKLEGFPAMDVVHGRWIEHPQYDVFGDCCYIDYECSLCHSIACEDAEHYSYCPNCGQPMDAKDMDVPAKDGGAE